MITVKKVRCTNYEENVVQKECGSVKDVTLLNTLNPSGILFEYEYEDRFLEKIRAPNLEK